MLIKPYFDLVKNVIFYEKEYSIKDDIKIPLVIIPWISLSNSNQLNKIQETFKDYYTILNWCWSKNDVTQKILECKFKGIFCVSYNSKIPIPQFTIPFYIKPAIYCDKNKIYKFSFVGWNNNYIRNQLFKFYGDETSVIKRERFFYLEKEERKIEQEKEYINILSNSRFSLCPRGISSGSFRLWESLKAGAIPIMISDEYKLPSHPLFKKSIIRLSESKFCNNKTLIKEEIKKISKEKETEMKENGIQIIKDFENINFFSSYLENCIYGSRL